MRCPGKAGGLGAARTQERSTAGEKRVEQGVEQSVAVTTGGWGDQNGKRIRRVKRDVDAGSRCVKDRRWMRSGHWHGRKTGRAHGRAGKR